MNTRSVRWGFLCLIVASSSFAAGTKASGIIFHCEPAKLHAIERDMLQYLNDLEIPVKETRLAHSKDGKALRYYLNNKETETSTLEIASAKKYDVRPDILSYTGENGKVRQGAFTSKKEIVLALMQNGRQYLLTGTRCSVDALKEHVGVRQNIAKWGMIVEARWGFPEYWDEKGNLVAKYSKLNPAFWLNQRDVPTGVPSHLAVADTFIGSFQYEIYCTMAAKLVMMQGIFDYYANVVKDAGKLAALNKIAAGSPLRDITPVYDNADKFVKAGKYLTTTKEVPPDNWIPGDWGYAQNTDEPSTRQAGYEGSNFIYLGGGKLSDQYGDDPTARHANEYFGASPEHNLPQKLQAIYNWRRGVTENWENDPRRAFLTKKEVAVLWKTPKDGGLLIDERDVWGDIF